MIVYNQQGVSLEEAKEKPFILEKDIQKLFEANLKAIMGLIGQFFLSHLGSNTHFFNFINHIKLNFSF